MTEAGCALAGKRWDSLLGSLPACVVLQLCLASPGLCPCRVTSPNAFQVGVSTRTKPALIMCQLTELVFLTISLIIGETSRKKSLWLSLIFISYSGWQLDLIVSSCFSEVTMRAFYFSFYRKLTELSWLAMLLILRDGPCKSTMFCNWDECRNIKM